MTKKKASPPKKAVKTKKEPKKPAKTEKKKLTVKERKFVGRYIETGNATKAADDAGFKSKSRGGLRAIASEKLKKLRLPIKELMERLGLDDVHLLTKLDQGLDAGVVKTASHLGTITDQRVYTDFETRARYLDMAFKLRGSYAPDKITFPKGIPINGITKELSEFIDRIIEPKKKKA